MFRPMTRTQTRTFGVAIPSSRQPLLEAMLRAFCWLVSNVVSMLATIFNRHTRDWHMDEAEDDHLPTPNELTQEALQAEPTGLSSGSGPSAAFPAEARVRNGVEGAIWSGGPNRVTEAASYARGLQTPHNVRRRNPSAPRALTGPPPSRRMRLATPALAPRSSRRKSGSRADVEPCPALQLQSCVRSTPILRFRRLIPSVSKDVGMSGICCGLQRELTA